MFRIACIVTLILAQVAPAQEKLAGPIQVLPRSLELRHQRQPHALQVMATTPDGYTSDLRSQAKFTSADPKIAVVDERGVVHPKGAGQTNVTIRAQGQTLTVPVTVKLPATEPLYSFHDEVMPALSRA